MQSRQELIRKQVRMRKLRMERKVMEVVYAGKPRLKGKKMRRSLK